MPEHSKTPGVSRALLYSADQLSRWMNSGTSTIMLMLTISAITAALDMVFLSCLSGGSIRSRYSTAHG